MDKKSKELDEEITKQSRRKWFKTLLYSVSFDPFREAYMEELQDAHNAAIEQAAKAVDVYKEEYPFGGVDRNILRIVAGKIRVLKKKP